MSKITNSCMTNTYLTEARLVLNYINLGIVEKRNALETSADFTCYVILSGVTF